MLTFFLGFDKCYLWLFIITCKGNQSKNQTFFLPETMEVSNVFYFKQQLLKIFSSRLIDPLTSYDEMAADVSITFYMTSENWLLYVITLNLYAET